MEHGNRLDDLVLIWTEALEIVVAQTRHERYRWLCSNENLDVAQRDSYRAYMIRKATGQPEPESKPAESVQPYPSLARQAWNASKAAAGFAASGFALATQEEQARRLAICKACNQYDAGRCKLCGCAMDLKTRMVSQHCPKSPPLW